MVMARAYQAGSGPSSCRPIGHGARRADPEPHGREGNQTLIASNMLRTQYSGVEVTT